MANPPQIRGTALTVPKTPVQLRMSEDNPLEECRSLARILAKKIETLHRECRSDNDKSMHIRTMGLTLATLTTLVNTPEQDSRAPPTSDILEDARGFTYRSVRFCDLERISDK
jgi:hypothetical protein